MPPLLGIALIVGLGLLVGSSAVRSGGERPARPRRRIAPSSDPFPDESATELAARDPLEALRRYGTEADAARLAESGVDLAALGYRPPHRR